MKRILTLFVAIIATATLSAQEPKALPLEQTIQKALDAGLIDQFQKVKLDSIAAKLAADRKAIGAQRKTLSKEEISKESRKVSKQFQTDMLEILGSKERYDQFNKIRYNK